MKLTNKILCTLRTHLTPALTHDKSLSLPSLHIKGARLKDKEHSGCTGASSQHPLLGQVEAPQYFTQVGLKLESAEKTLQVSP